MISSISPSMIAQSSPLLSSLRANGLTADKAIIAAADFKGAIQQVGAVQRGPANKAAISAALHERVSADVAAGKLSAEDAAAVYKTFEQLDPAKRQGGEGKPQQGAAPGGASRKGAGGPPPGGGGGGGAGADSNKTVLSESSIVIGNLKTTTTIYTDGTSDTKTEAVSADRMSKAYDKAAAAAGQQSGKAADSADARVKDYLSSFKPGSLFDILVQ